MQRRSDITIWIKNQSKEKILLETIKAYEACYPRKFEFIKQGLRRLREVTVEAHRDLKGREVDVNIRVPSELFLFLQSIIPDFGKDSDDIALLARTWEDFAVAKKRDKRFKKTLLWSSSFVKAPDHKEPAADAVESSRDQPKISRETPELPSQEVHVGFTEESASVGPETFG